MSASERFEDPSFEPERASEEMDGARKKPSAIGWSIGRLLRLKQKLTDDEVAQIVAYQKERHVRFGEAAVALKLATSDDVLHALSQQFNYAYSPELASRRGTAELVAAAHPFGEEAEAFRELRSHLTGGALSGNARVISVLSPNVGDGKTYIAANLAVALSQLGKKTLLVDADMRTPRQHQVFGIEPVSGLSSLLAGRTAKAVYDVPDLPFLFVMPAGPVPPNPLELVQQPVFSLLVENLKDKFEYVVVDTPAASYGADARAIAAITDSALVVGLKGKSRMNAMISLLDSLAKARAVVAGVVLNDR